MRTLVTADIHGNYRALMQCFKRCNFDYENDRLIVLGDTVDGFPYVRIVIDELLKIKNCIHVLGNHDQWAIDWYSRKNPSEDDVPEPLWYNQGGSKTIESYYKRPMNEAHLEFLKKSPAYYEQDNKIFVHGGFEPHFDPKKQTTEQLIWNRQLMETAWRKAHTNLQYNFSTYKEIYIGHTTTQTFKSLEPLFLCNVICMDTGAGWNGRLTIMDIDTKEFWQSDLATQLYPKKTGGR